MFLTLTMMTSTQKQQKEIEYNFVHSLLYFFYKNFQNTKTMSSSSFQGDLVDGRTENKNNCEQPDMNKLAEAKSHVH